MLKLRHHFFVQFFIVLIENPTSKILGDTLFVHSSPVQMKMGRGASGYICKLFHESR